MQYDDKELMCRDCKSPFFWTAGEQAFFREKGLQNVPVRCPECRAAKKVEMGIKPRAEHRIICADCGNETTVPFVPRQGRPVYCSLCYSKNKESSQQQPQEQQAASYAG